MEPAGLALSVSLAIDIAIAYLSPGHEWHQLAAWTHLITCFASLIVSVLGYTGTADLWHFLTSCESWYTPAQYHPSASREEDCKRTGRRGKLAPLFSTPW
jgi:hypothetical protein